MFQVTDEEKSVTYFFIIGGIEMNFGERIYELRSKSGMSQGELADNLEVSRQAVSKWENNSAVPELDKLLKMSELFSVSLDELVKGEKTITETTVSAQQEVVPVIIKQSLPMRKIVGLILFGMAFIAALVFFTMGGPLAMLYGAPLALCGAICYFCEKYVGLKCLWFLYYIIEVFLTFTTARIFAFDALFSGEWSTAAVLVLVLTAVNIFMIAVTSVKLKDEPIKKKNKAKKNLVLLWCSAVASFVILVAANLISYDLIIEMQGSDNSSAALSDIFYVSGVLDELVTVTLLSVAIPFTLRYKRLKREE